MTCVPVAGTAPSPSSSSNKPCEHQVAPEVCVNSNKEEHGDEASDSEDQGPIYYFGYGPIVNPVVRKRRGVKTVNEQAAMLPEHRLTFAYGGVVNAIRQRGYEVMGVLMAFEKHEDWARFQEFDAGYDLDQVQVYPLNDPEKPVLAHTFLMDHTNSDEDKLDGPLEKLPQERYLKLIATGMRAYQIDEEYIGDHIMSVPYVPKTKPEDFKVFPQTRQTLPHITLQRYQDRLCRNAGSGDVYFVIGTKVIRIDPHDPTNPGSVWLRERVHGKPDCTLMLHQTVVDPDLPMVDDPKDVTSEHVAWAENHFMEWLEQGGMSGTAVFRLLSSSGGDHGDPAASPEDPPGPLLSRIFKLVWGCRGKPKSPRGSGAGGSSRATSTSMSGGGGGSTTHQSSTRSHASGNAGRLSRMGSSSASVSSHRITTLRGSNTPSSGQLARTAIVQQELLDSPTQQSASLSLDFLHVMPHPDAGDTTDDDSSCCGG
jgi:hypothetical protein